MIEELVVVMELEKVMVEVKKGRLCLLVLILM